MKQVTVIGAGAAGLAAAIQAAREGARVTVLEHMEKSGKKLLSTGNGKCNLSNQRVPKGAYRGGQPELIQNVLRHVTIEQTLAFFRDLGLVLTEKNGCIYPNSGQALSVLEALLSELEHLGVTLLCGCEVQAIKKDLTLKTSKGPKQAHAVILAAGSMAAPKTGSDGSGYKLAKALGHSVIKPLPALVQLHCREKWLKQAAGVRTQAKVSLQIDGKTVAEDVGELQLTDYGISGIPVFQVSRFAARGIEEDRQVRAVLDLLPFLDLFRTEELFLERAGRFSYRPAGRFLDGVLNQKLAQILLRESGLSKPCKVGDFKQEQVKRLAHLTKNFPLTVTAANSFEQAQVCSGGVDLREVNGDTMESKLIPGLFFAGEILDVDGICGGYNLQWAWSSGLLAGSFAGRRK